MHFLLLSYTHAIAEFQVSTAIKIQAVAFWVMMPCSVVAGYQHFGRPCCYHLHTGLYSTLATCSCPYVKTFFWELCLQSTFDVCSSFREGAMFRNHPTTGKLLFYISRVSMKQCRYLKFKYARNAIRQIR